MPVNRTGPQPYLREQVAEAVALGASTCLMGRLAGEVASGHGLASWFAFHRP